METTVGSQRRNNRQIAVWLLVCCALIFAMVILGGVTRLTRSGLSIVEWDPVMGVIPPISQTDWQQTFDKYKQFPEYQKINREMSLEEFKTIFYFEYFHRILGRLIGLVFLIPFLVFLFMRKISRSLIPKLVFMFILGGLQGLLGWYMVKSGLVDNPHVSQYRLTAHLVMALTIYGYIFWVALDLLYPGRPSNANDNIRLKYFAIGVTSLIGLMIVSGGFVAGTRAGFIYNTFPLMNGQWVPETLLALTPLWRNFFDNAVTIQFTHRSIAYLLFIIIPVFWLFARRFALEPRMRTVTHLLVAMLIIQLTLGITTLLFQVPVSLAALHQAGALVLLTIALYINHGLRVSQA